jgi:hypothetical protein
MTDGYGLRGGNMELRLSCIWNMRGDIYLFINKRGPITNAWLARFLLDLRPELQSWMLLVSAHQIECDVRYEEHT